MSTTVDLDRLTDALTEYDQAFLVTVGDGGKPHVVAVQPVFADGVFDVGPTGDHTTANLRAHEQVSILWPPRAPGGYALMVDGRAESSDATVRVVPTKALLHRRAAPGSPAAESGCLHDCVVFKR